MFSNVYIFHIGVRQIINRVSGIKIGIPINNSNGLYINNSNGLYSVYHKQSDVVMLGDSITQGVEWNELLDRDDIVNRGIGGDTILGMLNRIIFIYKLNPKICFIMGGVNDMKYGISAEEVFGNYKKIITDLKEHNIIPIIQSTLYSNIASYEKTKELNRLLRQYAENNGLDYIDLNMVLSENKKLRNKFTYDGIHLTGKGYEVWGEEILKILKKYKKKMLIANTDSRGIQ